MFNSDEFDFTLYGCLIGSITVFLLISAIFFFLKGRSQSLLISLVALPVWTVHASLWTASVFHSESAVFKSGGLTWMRYGCEIGSLAVFPLLLALLLPRGRSQFLLMSLVGIPVFTLHALLWSAFMFGVDRGLEWQCIAEIAALCLGLFILNRLGSQTAYAKPLQGPTAKDKKALGRVCNQIAKSYSGRAQQSPALASPASPPLLGERQAPLPSMSDLGSPERIFVSAKVVPSSPVGKPHKG